MNFSLLFYPLINKIKKKKKTTYYLHLYYFSTYTSRKPLDYEPNTKKTLTQHVRS